MNYFNGNKCCLKEILDSVTAEDEATTLLILEYVKHYKGAVLGPVHKDGYGNTFFALPIISSSSSTVSSSPLSENSCF